MPAYPTIQIGRLRKGSNTILLGAETLTTAHRLRMRKGGTTYGIPLVATSDPLATSLRIRDGGVTKAFPKLGYFDGFTSDVAYGLSDGCGNYSIQGVPSNTVDSDTSSYYGWYMNNPHPEHWHNFYFNYTLIFPSAVTLLNLLYRILSWGGGRLCDSNYWVLEYYNGSWNTITSWSGSFPWSENAGESVTRVTNDTGEVAATINASNVTQIRFRSYANIYEHTGITHYIHTLKPFTI